MVASTSVLWAAIAVLMVDSIIELSFVSSMVAWLHTRAGRAFEVYASSGDQQEFSLHGKPLNLLLNQGHTSNGAAGTAFVLIGLGGILALTLRNYAARRTTGGLRKFGLGWYHFWLVMTVPALLLTLAALIYTFVITHDHAGQTIDVSVASQLNNEPYPNQKAYPLDEWTPENWFTAVLKLNLVSSSDRSDIRGHLDVMRGWRWNLVPMFIIQFGTTLIAFWDAISARRASRRPDIPETKQFLPS